MTICQNHQIEMDKTEIYSLGRTFVFESCGLCVAEKEEKENNERLKQLDRLFNERLNRDIPKRFFDAEIEDFKNIEIITGWLNNPIGNVFITGPCGTGKTHLAAASAHWLRKNTNKRIEFIITSTLFLNLRNSFNSNSEKESDIIKKYSTSAISIFDDIGAQKISEYVIESWYNIIDQRYGEELPTMFTSNMSLSEISTSMSDRIASRIASGMVFELNGQDRRLLK